MQQLRAGGEGIDPAEHAVVRAERGITGARSEQSIGDRTIRVIDDADRSVYGRGKNVGWHVERVPGSHHLRAAHVFGELTGMHGGHGCRWNRCPCGECIGHESVSA